ncbi:MAG: hypothetical protein HYT48_02545 [Candidatus Vogelbacteria bacterium]|nr:hypothetical protein [Candidatus Vogelbacteria bacterium]
MQRKINSQSGQALIVAAILFVIGSVAIIGGFVSPIVRTSRSTQDLTLGDRSYFLAESGAEDVAYRVQNYLPRGKVIDATADWQNRIRNLQVKLKTGTGLSFQYGLQAGNGGFQMGNNDSRVVGNVYSNGNISGGEVTNTAIAASSISLTADQANDTPTTPAYSIAFATTTAKEDLAQSFQVSASNPVNKVEFYIKKTSTPSDATVRITTDVSGSPSATTLTSGTLSAASVTTSYAWVPVVFSTNAPLAAGVTYWLVIDAAANASKPYTVGANANGYASGQAKVGRQSTGAWLTTSPTGLDAYFKLYVGGLTATISGVTIGSSGGDVWAHTVNNSTVTGNLYCQAGSGNNKSCDTSRADPTPQAPPISEAQIAQFKVEAEAGGTIAGNYTAGAMLGPKKITGNLSIGNDLTITGTVWVQGNLLVTANNKVVTLDPSYGTNGGVIVVDGYIDLSNGADFVGTGQAGSYIMLLTTSDCDPGNGCGRYAIDLPNHAGTVILNAQNGTLHLKEHASAKEVVAYKIVMDNHTEVTYEIGLANINFTSGPSGGWSFTGWGETP